MKAKKWTIISPVTVSICADTPIFLDECCGEEQESFDLDMSQSANLVNSSDSLSSFLANVEKEDLREHYDEDRNIYKIVFGDTRISEECDRILALTYVYTSPELQELPKEVLDFISGQLSDGWGEGKEQEDVKLCTYYRKTQNFSVESGEMEEAVFCLRLHSLLAVQWILSQCRGLHGRCRNPRRERNSQERNQRRDDKYLGNNV